MSTSKNILKTYFQTGDFPTETQFSELIDSFRHVDDGKVIRNFTINGNGDLTITLNTNETIQVNKFVLPSSMPVSFINGLQSIIDNSVTVGQLNEAIATSAYGIKYSWDTEAERNAQTGMKKDEQGVQKNTREVYKYTGSNWVLFYTLDAVHNHDDRYYTESESDTRFLGKTAKAVDSDRLDGLDSSAFARASHSHPWSQITDVPATFPASDHNHDDRYYTESESDVRFLGKTAKAADSDRLDGLDGSAYAKTSHNHDDRYYTESESDSRFLGKTEKAADSNLLDGLDSSAFARTSHNHDDRYYTESESNARFLGKTAKASDSDRLDGIDSSGFARQEVIPAKTLNTGWYTIAVNNGDRASAKFVIRETRSSYHQAVHFYAGHHFGNGNIITVLSNSSYANGGVFRYLRIKEGDTYDGVMLQVYIDVDSSPVYGVILEDIQSSGWIAKNWVSDGTDPGNVSNFSALTNVAAEVDLDNTLGVQSTEDIYINNDKVYHEGHKPTAAEIGALAIGAKATDSDRLDGLDSSAFLKTTDLKKISYEQSGRDFTHGTLIKTNINYSGDNGEPWLLEIQGNSYGSRTPFDVKYQGYIYNGTIINHGGISNGTKINNLEVFNHGGFLCFWFPRQAYWQGFSVFVNDSNGGTKENRLVSITDEVIPSGITKRVDLSSSLNQSWHNGNDGAGSGLDADKLDGLEGSAYARVSHNHNDLYYTESESNARFLGKTAKAADSDKLDGFNSASGATANTVPVRDGAADVHARLFRSNYQTQGSISSAATVTMRTSTSDNYLRHVTKAGFLSWLGKVNDANSLDGLDSGQFLRSDADDTFVGKLSLGSTAMRQGGIYGIYDSKKIGHIWSMGTAYKIAADGANFGNLYGFAYKHTNNATGGTMAGGHQAIWCENGSPRAAMGSAGLWSASGVTAVGNITGSDIYGTGTYYYGDGKRVVQFSDSWLRLNPSNHFSSGIYCASSILRTDNRLEVGGGGSAFYANSAGDGKFNRNLTVNGHVYGRSVNAAYSNLYRFGGVYLTWDSDSYGTNTEHSIRSTYGNTYGDSLTMNSFNNIRLNIDSNNNNSNSKFEIGNNTTGTSNVLFSLDETGTVRAKGDVVAYSTSDMNLKSAIKPIASPLRKINQLSGNEFVWNKKQTTYEEGSKDYGIIAQEVASVLPEAVRTNEDTGHLSVRYEKLIPLLIEGMKEQQGQIEELKTKLYGTTN